ncbi:hypothetical protein TrVE_jg7027 [Triparma verrucosa]|uniref:Uncharacterized protein n=1 Tax=Triparma verrucosa TaxID=1606542 RepID=A0A9W7C8K3_9STRA|nr:hypothetical protein TrVE_jg7027 [Triparma verrucosa]
MMRGSPVYIALTVVLIAVNGADAWCGSCDNAPSRSWSWWFGFGKCNCEGGWSGSCCNSWTVSDWDQKVDDWKKGLSCEAQPENACKKNSNPPATPSVEVSWLYEPDNSKSTERQCTDAGCLWTECFPSNNAASFTDSVSADEMCSHCSGPWAGKCDWHSYSPGFLAFAGPGKHCGFNYPDCPASAGKNCWCEDAAKQDLADSWCNNGSNQDRFCPKAFDHGDGRVQSCSWSGWTIAPQTGNIDNDCASWGAAKSGDPQSKAVMADQTIKEFKKAEPGVAVEGATISGAAAVFLSMGAIFGRRRLKKRKSQGAEGGEGVQLKGTNNAV